MHLADCLGIPLLGIYGPVDENVYGPAASARGVVVTRAVPCRPCYRHFHFPPCPYGKRCLEEITVDEVMNQIEHLTEAKKP